MSSSSKNITLDFFFSGSKNLDRNQMSLVHDSVIDKVSALDSEHFPVPWKKQKWLNTFKEKNNSYMLGIWTEDFEIQGFILLGLDDPDCAHLYKILVAPDLQRHGIASSLMTKTIENLKNLYVKTIFLEVEQSNFEALGFYRKHGYKVLVAKNDFYGSLRHAWAMELKL